jgi:hypothetical protein
MFDNTKLMGKNKKRTLVSIHGQPLGLHGFSYTPCDLEYKTLEPQNLENGTTTIQLQEMFVK